MVDIRMRVEDGDLTVHGYQDCEDIVERNKELARHGKQHGEFRMVASIPLNILNMWLQEEWNRGNTQLKWSGPEFDRLVQRKLRDPDWRYLRTDW
jgi:hypothetical protein